METLFEKGGSRGYVSVKDVSWEIGKKKSGWVLTVPAGREFESSVPTLSYKNTWLQKLLGWFQPFHWVLSPDDPRFLKAALIHDVLLESGYTKHFSDSQWLEVNKSQHTPKWNTRLAYLGMVVRRLFKNV